MANNDWKSRIGMVYSTNPDFRFETGAETEAPAETLPKERQRLRVRMERTGRKGKTVTIVTGFVGTEADLKELAKLLKTKLCTGGNAKDEEIVIQGDMRARTVEVLKAEGYPDVK